MSTPPPSRTEQERAAADRLRWFRTQLKMTRAEFGQSIGIGRERLASYEDHRAPLRWEIARRVALRYGLNPRWLALGDVPAFAPYDEAALLLPIGPRELLFSAFATHLAARIPAHAPSAPPSLAELRAHAERLQTMLAQVSGAAPELRDAICADPAFLFLASRLAARALFALHESEETRLLNGAPDSWGGDFSLNPAGVNPRFDRGESAAFIPQVTLDNGSSKGDTDRMSDKIWNNVRRRLLKVTKERGAKSRLAEHVGVSRQAVNQWLAGTSTPDGKNMLTLLEWVKAAEAK